MVLIKDPSRRLWGTAHARTRLAFYTSADSEGEALSAGRIPNSTSSVRSPKALYRRHARKTRRAERSSSGVSSAPQLSSARSSVRFDHALKPINQGTRRRSVVGNPLLPVFGGRSGPNYLVAETLGAGHLSSSGGSALTIAIVSTLTVVTRFTKSMI